MVKYWGFLLFNSISDGEMEGETTNSGSFSR